MTVDAARNLRRARAGRRSRARQPAGGARGARHHHPHVCAREPAARHRADGFDLCDQTHCQVVRAAIAATERAAQATAGPRAAARRRRRRRSSTRRRAAAAPRFRPTSGPAPRIRRSCRRATTMPARARRRGRRSLDERDLLRALRAGGFRGDRLRDVRIASRNASGRVARLTLDGLRPEQISGQDLRVAVGRTLGWQHIKSTAFELRRQGDAYRFTRPRVGPRRRHVRHRRRRGWPSGATSGRRDPRDSYFPGLEISGLPSDQLRHRSDPGRTPVGRQRSVREPACHRVARRCCVSLPDDDEGAASGDRHARPLRARDELARALGVAPPPHVTLRFHPTTDDYETRDRPALVHLRRRWSAAKSTCCRWPSFAIAACSIARSATSWSIS